MSPVSRPGNQFRHLDRVPKSVQTAVSLGFQMECILFVNCYANAVRVEGDPERSWHMLHASRTTLDRRGPNLDIAHLNLSTTRCNILHALIIPWTSSHAV